MWCRHHTNPSHSQSIRPEDKVYAVETSIIYHETVAESVFEPCATPGGRYRYTSWVASSATASYFNRCGITPKTSIVPDTEMKVRTHGFLVSYEHIPLWDHACRTTAETRRKLELNYATQVASATNVKKWRRWLWRRSKESGAMSIRNILDKGDQQSGSYLRGWSCVISKKKSAHAIWW